MGARSINSHYVFHGVKCRAEHLSLGLTLVFLQRALVHNAVEKQNVPADGAFASVDVADENNIHVLLDPRNDSGRVCKVSRL